MRLQSLRSGDIDIFQTADTDNIVDVVSGGDDFKVQKVSGSSSTIVLFNLDKPPFDDIRMRQAFAYALNRNEINRVQYKGSRRESYSAFDPDTAFYAEGIEVPKYDLEKAKDLVADLKADGKQVDYTLICIPTDEARRLLGLAQSQMKKVGMTQTNEFKDQGSYVNQISRRAATTRPGASATPRSPAPTGCTRGSTPVSRAT